MGFYRYIVKFARIKTYLQIQRNIGKIMLIKIMIITDICGQWSAMMMAASFEAG